MGGPEHKVQRSRLRVPVKGAADILRRMQMVELGPRQGRVVAVAVTLLAIAVIGAFMYGFFVLLARFVIYFSPVLTPLAVAAILALILRPYYEWVVHRVRLRPLAVTLTLLSVLLPVALLCWRFGSIVGAQLSGLAASLPVWVERMTSRIEAWLPQLTALLQAHGAEVKESLGSQGGWLATQLAMLTGHLVTAGMNLFRVLGGLLSWVVLPVYLVFLLGARPLSVSQVRNLLPFLKQETRDDVAYLAREFVNILVAFFRGQLLIALAQGVLYAIGFGAVGLQYGIALGLTLGILNIIPYLGNIIGLCVALPLAYFQTGGGLGTVAAVLAVFGVVQGIEAYVLTPRIMGQRTGLHPMAVVFALFFWGAALQGLLGMILGIPLTAFLVVFWRLLKAKYIKELV